MAVFESLKNQFRNLKLKECETHWKIFNVLFQLTCFCVVTFLGYLCYHEFIRNEDFCEVNFKKMYNEKETVYPSLSLCFTHPIYDNKLQKYEQGLNYTTYESSLLGHEVSDKLFNISYSDVSLHLKDHIIDVGIATDDDDEVYSNATALMENISSASWGIAGSAIVKCFTFHIPYKIGVKVNGIGIKLKNSIFPNGIRPTHGWDSPFGLHVYFHGAQEFIRSYSSRKYIWPEREANTSYKILAYLSGMEVISRRQKPDMPCNENSGSDDWIYQNFTHSVGCRPPYWSNMGNTPICNKKEHLMYFAHTYWETFVWNLDLYPPCKEMNKLQVDYEEKEFEQSKDNDGSWFVFKMVFRDLTYKEIKQNRAYDGKKLIGDFGGYIGLLLGYALIKLPDFLFGVYSSFKRRLLNRGQECQNRSAVTNEVTVQNVLPNITPVENDNDERKLEVSPSKVLKQKDVNCRMDFIEQQVKQNHEEILGKLAELANSISSSRKNEKDVTQIYVA